jgi:hypothetical protein
LLAAHTSAVRPLIPMSIAVPFWLPAFGCPRLVAHIKPVETIKTGLLKSCAESWFAVRSLRPRDAILEE